MKLLTFACPVSSAIHFRGIVGKIGIIDEAGNPITRVKLDPNNTLPENVSIIQQAGGVLNAEASTSAYHALQVFCTNSLIAGNRVVSSSGVTDQSGNKIRPPNSTAQTQIRFEIAADSVMAGPNVWVGWMVSKIGKIRLRLFGNGKEIATREFTAEEIPESKFVGVNVMSDMQLANHVKKNIGTAYIGEVVSIGLSVKELESVSDLKLTV